MEALGLRRQRGGVGEVTKDIFVSDTLLPSTSPPASVSPLATPPPLLLALSHFSVFSMLNLLKQLEDQPAIQEVNG